MSKELIDIVKDKNFKTFWHCLDYLLMAGYKPIEAFGASIQEFGESRIFSDVAFIRVSFGLEHIREMHSMGMAALHERERLGLPIAQIFTNDYMDDLGNTVSRVHPPISYTVTVGLIDDGNIHLAGLYSVYRKWYVEGKFSYPQTEIEDIIYLK